MILETDRLILRDWTDDDLQHMIRLRGHPQVMRHFPGTETAVKIHGYFPRIQDFSAKNGYAFRPVLTKNTGEFAGFCGISQIKFNVSGLPDTEVGWSFLPQFWGKGYATEAARRWLQFGFEEIALKEIVAFAVTGNLPSHAVMQRLGMKRDEARDFDHPNVPEEYPNLIRHIVYSISSGEWQSSQLGQR